MDGNTLANIRMIKGRVRLTWSDDWNNDQGFLRMFVFYYLSLTIKVLLLGINDRIPKRLEFLRVKLCNMIKMANYFKRQVEIRTFQTKNIQRF